MVCVALTCVLVHKEWLQGAHDIMEATHNIVVFARTSDYNTSRLEYQKHYGRVVGPEDQSRKYARLVCAARAILRVQFLYVNGVQIRDPDVAHYVLDRVVLERHVQIRKHVFQHVDSASNSSHSNLFARRPCDHQLARRKEQRRRLGLVDADGDGSKAFLVVTTVGYTARNHIEINPVCVCLDMNGRHHVVCGRNHLARRLLSVEFLTNWLVVEHPK